MAMMTLKSIREQYDLLLDEAEVMERSLRKADRKKTITLLGQLNSNRQDRLGLDSLRTPQKLGMKKTLSSI